MTAKPTEVTYPAGVSLADLNIQMAADELSLGPLIKLANDGTLTVLTFDARGPRVTTPARLLLKVGGAAVAPPGSVNVCEGIVFLAGQKTDVVAVRP